MKNGLLAFVFATLSLFSFAQPTADFSFSYTDSCDATAAINFTDQSTGSPIFWEWDFGDGTISTLQNPSHQYASYGTYQVRLIATDAGSMADTTLISIESAVSPPFTAFTSVIDVSCAGSFDGSVFVQVTGGTTPFTFLWSDGSIGQGINNAAAGTYTVWITDAKGCSTSETVTLTAPPPVAATVVNVINDTCDTAPDGAIDISVSGGVAPYIANWSHGTTTLNQTGLAAGVYSATIVDANGCTAALTATVSQVSSHSAVLTTVDESCAGAEDGSIMASLSSGGVATVYQWNNGAATPSVTGLAAGVYCVNIIDTAGCSFVICDTVEVVGQNCVTLSGYAYIDTDSNCQFTGADVPLANTLIDITPGGSFYTDATGYYEIPATNGSIDVDAIVSTPYLAPLCPANASYTVNTTSGVPIDTLHFSFKGVQVADGAASMYCGVARPGFSQSLSARVNSIGNLPTSGVVVLKVDSRIDISTATHTVPPDSVDLVNNLMYWSYNLQPQQSFIVYVYVTLPLIPQINLGDVLEYTTYIDPVADVDPLNDTAWCFQTVVGSYDPNNTEVYTMLGMDADGDILEQDTLLKYVINFQNTGTDTAFNIVVRDTLESKLIPSTFVIDQSSHNYRVVFASDTVVEFYFDNVLLPDSNVNEPQSHGFISFFMETEKNLPLGSEITNGAGIYFDFNPPIITNRVRSVITEPVGIHVPGTVNQLQLYPNPTTGKLYINNVDDLQQIEVFDLMGRSVYSQTITSISNAIEVDLNGLNAGLYLAKGTATDKVYSGSFVKQ